MECRSCQGLVRGARGGGGVLNCEAHEVQQMGFRPDIPSQEVCTGTALVCMASAKPAISCGVSPYIAHKTTPFCTAYSNAVSVGMQVACKHSMLTSAACSKLADTSEDTNHGS